MRAPVVSLFLLALLLPAAFLPASLGQAHAAAAAQLEILSFGSGSSEINVVLDGDKLSMFANQCVISRPWAGRPTARLSP